MIQVIRRKLHSVRPYLREDARIALLMGAAVLVMLLTDAGCPIKRAAGVSCPGCGMSRALLCLLRLDISGAVYFHPLSVVMPFAAAAWLFRRKIPTGLLRALAGILIAAFFVCWLLRISAGDPVLSAEIEEGFIYRIIKEVYDVLSELR